MQKNDEFFYEIGVLNNQNLINLKVIKLGDHLINFTDANQQCLLKVLLHYLRLIWFRTVLAKNSTFNLVYLNVI